MLCPMQWSCILLTHNVVVIIILQYNNYYSNLKEESSKWGSTLQKVNFASDHTQKNYTLRKKDIDLHSLCVRLDSEGKGEEESSSSKPVRGLTLSIPLYFTDPAPLIPTPRDDTCHVHTTTYNQHHIYYYYTGVPTNNYY